MAFSRDAMLYAELAVTTNYSFLRGASHPEEYVGQALHLKLSGLGIADRNSLAGVVRAHAYARAHEVGAQGLRVVTGTRLVFCDGTPDILAYPRDRAAYGRLSQLLTRGNLRAQKGACRLGLPDLLAACDGLQLIVTAASSWDAEDEGKRAVATYPDFDHPEAAPSSAFPSLGALLPRLAEAAPERVWLAASMTYGRAMRQNLAALARLARETHVPLIATNDVLMHHVDRRCLQDVLTAIRLGCTLETAGRRLEANAERHLKSGAEMLRLFAEAPQAVEETLHCLEGIAFSLDQLSPNYPEELREGFATPQDALEAFAREGAIWRYPQGVPASVTQAIEDELKLVATLGYAPYFLTVHDIVRFARAEKILCQGRGSAANSTLCYCLGITEVDPTTHDLLFARFISTERNEPPDIDVDFEHEKREVVMQYIYRRYGRARTGLTASVITYRSRSAIRDVGKVFGLSEDTLRALSTTIWGGASGGVDDKQARRLGFDPSEPRLAKALALAGELCGFPRHLSQHTGGFVITHTRLDAVVPIAPAAMKDRTTIEWDKDDLDTLGILKVDILALGMLTCLRMAFHMIAEHYGRDYTLANMPAEERAVYAMISRADTIGVFQIESRAQMSMLPRLKPAKFYDLVIEVAIVRPGPIQGDMVHPYLRRRQKLEPEHYPSPELEGVLKKTLGVPLFQEQAMKIAIVAAGFTPAEADRLRRAMATFKRVGTINTFRDKMINGMVARGYEADFAARCFSQIEGFGTYGFPESHAASFALLVYASAWVKCRYPDVFAAALLNAQPMGFYAPSQIVRDAREHGVEILEVDVNFSEWDAILCARETLSQGERVAPEAPGEGLRSESLPGNKRVISRTPHPEERAAGVRLEGWVQCTGPSFETAASRLPQDEGCGPSGRRLGLHPRHVSMQSEIYGTRAVRLGLRQVHGLAAADMEILTAKRGAGYDSIRDLWLRTGLAPSVLEKLAAADAFRSLGLDRRSALWAVRGLNRAGDKDDLPLLRHLSFSAHEPEAWLPTMPLGEHVVEDYRRLSLSLKAHPVTFVRHVLTARGILRCAELAAQPSGHLVTVAGLVLVRQRPGSAKGVIFLTLEDETGIANAIIWPKVFEILRPIVIGARFIAVTGRLQNESGIIHIIAERAEDLTPLLGLLSEHGGEISSLARADAVKRPNAGSRADPRDDEVPRHVSRVLPKGRNFH